MTAALRLFRRIWEYHINKLTTQNTYIIIKGSELYVNRYIIIYKYMGLYEKR